MSTSTTATASSPSRHRDALSHHLRTGVASHTAIANASTSKPSSISRYGSALRATGSDHSFDHGSVASLVPPTATYGPTASATTSTNMITRNRASRSRQLNMASASTSTSSGMPTYAASDARETSAYRSSDPATRGVPGRGITRLARFSENSCGERTSFFG